MNTQQPEALRLAYALEQATYLLSVERDNTAAELRRLHGENERLKAAQQEPVCRICNGTGEMDSGGTHPWGWAINIPCECTAPPAQVAPVQPVQELEHITDGGQCWCNPDIDYIDPNTGAAVIVHKEPQ